MVFQSLLVFLVINSETPIKLLKILMKGNKHGQKCQKSNMDIHINPTSSICRNDNFADNVAAYCV